MMTKYLRLGLAMAGAMFALGSLAACADDSTASAPITSNPVTTTSLYAASKSSSAASSETTSSEASSSAAATPQAQTPSPTTGGSTLPATAPTTTTTATPASGSFASPNGQVLDAKSKKYLQALRDDNVTILGDTDNSVALTLAVYVCDAQKKNTDPVTTKGYVTALVAPGTNSTQEANTKADKVIKAAKAHYC